MQQPPLSGQIKASETGSQCVAIAPTAPFNKHIPRAMKAFRKANPHVALTPEEGLSNEVAVGLANQRIDVAFVRSPKLDAGKPIIVIGPPGTGLHDETFTACRSAGFSPRIGQQAPWIASALGLVAAGPGIVLVLESTKALRMGGVVYRSVKGPHEPNAFLGLAYRWSHHSEALRRFVSLVRNAAP